MHSSPVSGPATSSGELPTKHYTTISKPVSSDVLTLILIAETLDQAFFEEMINKFSLEISSLSEEYEDEDEDGSYNLEDDDRFYDEEWHAGSFQGKYFFLKWVVEYLVWENREREREDAHWRSWSGEGWRVDEIIWAGRGLTDLVGGESREEAVVGGYRVPVYDMCYFPDLECYAFKDGCLEQETLDL